MKQETLLIETGRFLKASMTFVVILLALTVAMTLFSAFKIEKMESRMHSMERQIEKRSYIDSLYLDHLGKCSFILKDDIKTDSRGYLYSSYKKNPNIIINE